jgi:hypothetical protein
MHVSQKKKIKKGKRADGSKNQHLQKVVCELVSYVHTHNTQKVGSRGEAE